MTSLIILLLLMATNFFLGKLTGYGLFTFIGLVSMVAFISKIVLLIIKKASQWK